ncbi:MAG: diguanylate cyclase [Pseudomonadota bacterium]
MLRLIGLFIALLLTSVFAHAQDPAPSAEEARLTEQIQECERLEHGQPDQAIELINPILEQLDADLNPFLTMRALGCRSWSLIVLGQSDAVVADMQEIERITRASLVPAQQAQGMSMLSALHQRMGEPDASLAWLTEALDIALAHDLKEELVKIYTNLGIEYSVAQENDRAIEYYELALAVLEEVEDQRNRLPILYNLGLTYRGADRLEEASATFDQLVEPLSAPGMEVRLASLLSVMAGIEREQGLLDEAEAKYQQAMALHEDLNNPSERTVVLIELGYLSIEKNNIDAALNYSEQALVTARQSELDLSIQGALNLRGRALELAGRYEESIDHIREFNERNEAYLREQQDSVLTQMRADLDFERQAVELAELRSQQQQQEYDMNQQRLITNSSLVIAVLILVGLLLAYFWQRKTNRRLTQLSQTDQLTGLPNRRRIMDFLSTSINQDNADQLVLMLLDLDYFKKINDDHGHDAGDRALIEVAKLMRNFAEANQVEIGRWGGEEFLLLFKSKSAEHAMRLTGELLDQVAAIRIPTRGQPIELSASAGFVAIGSMHQPGNQRIWEPALLAADQLLYRAKQAGRAGFFGLWPMQDKAKLEPNTLDSAIESGQFQLLNKTV